MTTNKYLVVAALIGILVSGSVQSVRAQSVGVSIRPATHVIYARPGTSVNIPIVLKNIDSPASYQFKAVRLTPKGNYGVLESSLDLPDGISMTIPEKEAQFLGIGAEKKTSVKITVDKTAPSKDYYLGFIPETVGKKHSEGKSSIALTLQPVSTILLTVTDTGVLQNSGYISSFTIANNPSVRFFDSHDEIQFDLVAGNSGANWLIVTGAVTTTDSFGNIEHIQVPKQRVLANSKRLLRTTNTNTPEHSLILNGFHVGKYSVKTQLTFEGKPGVQTKLVTFVVFPFKLTALLLGLVIVAVFVVSKLNHPAPLQGVQPRKL